MSGLLEGVNLAQELRHLGVSGRDGVGDLTQWFVSFARWARSRFKNCCYYKRASDEVHCVYMLLLATSGLDRAG